MTSAALFGVSHELRPILDMLSNGCNAALWRWVCGVVDSVEGDQVSNLKTKAYRDKNLLDFARGKPCLLTAVNDCLGSRDTSTTVACHSNQSRHGKGLGRKADDCYTVWGCMRCHAWLDQGKAGKAEKVRAFDAALGRQVKAWEDFEREGTGMGWELIAVKKALERLKND